MSFPGFVCFCGASIYRVNGATCGRPSCVRERRREVQRVRRASRRRWFTDDPGNEKRSKSALEHHAGVRRTEALVGLARAMAAHHRLKPFAAGPGRPPCCRGGQ